MTTIFRRRPGVEEIAAHPSWRSAAGVLLPVAVAVLVIAAESTVTFSSANTSGWLRPVFQWVLGPIRDSTWDLVHHLIRKSGHFIGYGTVCLTFLRAWLITLAKKPAGQGERSWRLQSSGLAIGCTALVASADEFHQTMLPGRTGLFSDVVLDTCGATVMCLLIWLIFGRAGGWESSRGPSRQSGGAG